MFELCPMWTYVSLDSVGCWVSADCDGRRLGTVVVGTGRGLGEPRGDDGGLEGTWTGDGDRGRVLTEQWVGRRLDGRGS